MTDQHACTPWRDVGGLRCHYPLIGDDTEWSCLDLAPRSDLVPTGALGFQDDVNPDLPVNDGVGDRPLDDAILFVVRKRRADQGQ